MKCLPCKKYFTEALMYKDKRSQMKNRGTKLQAKNIKDKFKSRAPVSEKQQREWMKGS